MKKLTWGQVAVLTAATLPMAGAGGLGAWGTYTNITSVFHRSATALGVVAAGEGATLVLALVLVGLTMLGQAAPAAVRIGLWLLPATASITGAIVAPGARDAVVFAVTPMAMTVSAEGLGLLARRIVVHRTGVDVEAQRRNATALRRIAFQQARAARHPRLWVRRWSALRAWRLLRQVGDGDILLGVGLVEVQRERLTEGASAALAEMLGVGTPAIGRPEISAAPNVTPELEAAFEDALRVASQPAAEDVVSECPDAEADTSPDMSGQPDNDPDGSSGHPDEPSGHEEAETEPKALASPDTRPDRPDPLSEIAKAASGPSDLVRSLATHGVPKDALVSEAVRLRPDMVADSIRRIAKRLGEGPYL